MSGNAEHSKRPPVDQNYIVLACMAAVALLYMAWVFVSLTFLPLAVPFFVVILAFGVCLPFIALLGMNEFLGRIEIVLDEKFVIIDDTVKIEGQFFVKAYLVQLISTVVILASTSN